MQRRTWIGIGILVGLVILIALTVGLVVGLRKHKKKDSPDSGPSLDDILSNDSTFPNGSYQVSTGSLKAGPNNLKPILVTLQDLKSLGLIVDNSSLVAETNRLSVMFVRIPRNGTARIQFGGIGVRFGSSDTLNVVPLNLSSITNSGLRYIGLLQSDRSDVYQVQVRMAEQMCANSASGSCSIINWSPYFVLGDNLGSAANFSNELPVACGSQCDANSTSRCATSCSTCDGQQVAGANTPVTRRYRMNTTSARNLLFTYETYQVPDRVTVTYAGVNLFDSTCIGTNGEKLTPITYEGRYSEVRVDLEPNCDGTDSTQWYFTLPCAGGCQGCDFKLEAICKD
ncbi:unnamed protein product, partial [Mesorhabditis belari]|uniref:Uncharacterized protein n=1 Tax=Mesorhabditis belari TaxID=2138241 RepID=A0AAF3JC44_9BILA